MRITLIAALSDNNVIGRDGTLPWKLPNDMKHFKALTMDHPVIMGRKTYESLPMALRPLPGRRNIILTHKHDYRAPGCDVVSSIHDAIKAAAVTGANEAFVIGGAEMYRLALPAAHRLELTRVHAEIKGDTYFPEVFWKEWKQIAIEEHPADERHAYPYSFVTYDRLPHH